MNARNQEVSHSLYVFDSKPPVRKALPISLQHIMAMFLGTVTVPIVIAGAAGADAATRTIMIQYSLMMSALATMIQVCPLGPVVPDSPSYSARALPVFLYLLRLQPNTAFPACSRPAPVRCYHHCAGFLRRQTA